MKTSDKGFLLHRISYSESSLILVFYTQKSGLAKFIFKGGKKKKIAMHPLGLYEIAAFKRPESELGIISTLQWENPSLKLLDKPLKVLICFFLSDVLRQTLQEEQADTGLFNFLENAMQNLNTSQDDKAFPVQFLIEFIQLLGFEPQTMEDPKFFDLSNAAFLTESSGLPNEINGPIVTFLNDMFLMEASDLELYKEALPIILKYMKLHLPSFDNEKSLGIIKDILYT